MNVTHTFTQLAYRGRGSHLCIRRLTQRGRLLHITYRSGERYPWFARAAFLSASGLYQTIHLFGPYFWLRRYLPL